jgi:hypothetical protein
MDRGRVGWDFRGCGPVSRAIGEALRVEPIQENCDYMGQWRLANTEGSSDSTNSFFLFIQANLLVFLRVEVRPKVF